MRGLRQWQCGLAVLCIALLAACGGPRSSAPQTEVARSVDMVTINAPGFGDADPFDWPGRGPDSYPVHGADVSRWQGDVNWFAARDAGVNFVFIKATEGGDRVDPLFARQWEAAKAAGVRRGSFHFFYFCTPADVQARWYIANVPRGRGDLPPVLDVEWNPHSPTCTTRPDPAKVRSEIGIFLDIVGRHYGQRPIIYTTAEFWQENGFDRITGEEFWLRSTAAHPHDIYAGADWVFWQYTGTGLVPGINGRVDLNVFAGTQAGWRAWLARRSQ